MLLKSSSTPVIGTLLSPFSECPNRDFDTINKNQTSNYTKHHPLFHYHKLSFSQCLHYFNLTSAFSCSSCSRVSELNQETSSFCLKGFRRAWSDSNLERLAYTSCDKEEFHNPTTPKKFHYAHHRTMLHSVPSFSIFNTSDGLEGVEKNGGDMERVEEEPMRTVTIGESIKAVSRGEFSFRKRSMGLIEEEGEQEQEECLTANESLLIEEEKEPVSPPLYLAAGLGIDGDDFGGGGGTFDLTLPNFDESGDAEEYYKRMVDEYPCYPLFLRNYAQLLQSKGDLHGAEDYYHRATLADPDDGEILMLYAKLGWELHRDQDKALSNFERAVQAAPHDSHVLAAYASFLWEIDDDGEEETSQQRIKDVDDGSLNKPDNSATNEDFKPLQLLAGLRVDVQTHAASDPNKDGNVEEYYKKRLDENPCNSLILRNYAHFLWQSKGDLKGAEEYYTRAMQADPEDGEIMSQYAKLVWELHRDHDKATCYFEQAVQATPEDSYVLASYASFLWETEENEDRTEPGEFLVPVDHEGAVTAGNA